MSVPSVAVRQTEPLYRFSLCPTFSDLFYTSVCFMFVFFKQITNKQTYPLGLPTLFRFSEPYALNWEVAISRLFSGLSLPSQGLTLSSSSPYRITFCSFSTILCCACLEEVEHYFLGFFDKRTSLQSHRPERFVSHPLGLCGRGVLVNNLEQRISIKWLIPNRVLGCGQPCKAAFRIWEATNQNESHEVPASLKSTLEESLSRKARKQEDLPIRPPKIQWS